MGKFNLIIQKGLCMKPINGDLCVDGNGTAQFFSPSANGADSQLIGKIDRIRVDHASSQGILISGFEVDGNKARLQEWWLVFSF